MTERRPYLSAVVTSRNDDHGGNMGRRMQTFVDAWFAQVRKHGLDIELILVEWNPPSDREPLAKALKWPEGVGSDRLRIITVPASIHARFLHADSLPLYQFVAKNVGIRRARGQFVLATNIDVILSSELCAFLAEERLDPKKIYRNDRYDVSDAIAFLPPNSDYEAFCNEHLIRINGPTWTVDLRDGRIHQVFLSKRFKAITRAAFALNHAVALLGRLPWLIPMLAGLYGSGRSGLAKRLLKAAFRSDGESKDLTRKPIAAHVNACGDFTMMHRDVWANLRGHLEYDGYSMHVDSIILLAAIASRQVTEEVLPYPMRHFHIDHSAGSGYTPEAASAMYSRLSAKGIPYLLWDDVERLIDSFELMPERVRYNDENWGLVGEEFIETVPGQQG